MNKKVDKTIENLVDKMMKDVSHESPSLDFTNQVMSQVDQISQSDVTVYKPLISKPIWFGLLALVVGVLIYSLFNGNVESSLLSSVNFDVLTNNGISNTLSNVSISKPMLYAALLFALMLAIQIPLLKGHFNKRLNL